MPLSAAEVSALEELDHQRQNQWTGDERLFNYYRGQQRVEQLGMAIPPRLRQFMVVVNWPRVVVDTTVDRQQVRALILLGRSFMSVGTNPRNGNLPLIRVESPREMVAAIDLLNETITVAARFFGVTATGWGPTHATLFMPDYTVWCRRDDGQPWAEVRRDVHKLGAVPVVLHLNRRMSTEWSGESLMSDVIPLTDAAVRALTNMQFTQEAHGAPRKFVTGASQADFTDAQGNPTPAWEAYLDAIHILTNPAAKVGQLEAADLSNFETAINIYGKQAATVSGFPARYFGLHTANPPAEGAIYADEAQLVRSIEAQNDEVGTTLGWVGGLALRFATGQWVEGNRVRVDWHDPATPTVAQRTDAIVKLTQGAKPILSREGAWDRLGMSEAEKDKERQYFAAELNDPTIQLANSLLNGSTDAALGDA